MTRIHDTWATKDAPIGLELFYSGSWHNITDDMSDAGLVITRRLGEPAEMSCSLKNADGQYSPRHPLSALYGLAGRNTPVRAWVEAGTPRLVLDGVDATATTPDAAAFAVTDLDVRVDLRRESWWTATSVIHQYANSGNQRGWTFFPQADGYLSLYWSEDGSATDYAWSTAVLPHETGRLSIRFTFDADNGSSGHTTTFYYSETPGLAGPWTQLGDAVTAAGVVALYNGTAPLTVGDTNSAGRFTGEVYSAQVRSAIDGTIVASPDFEAQASGAGSFDDAQGNTWTINSPASLTDRHYRFTGEVAAWPQRWGRKGSVSAYSPIECAGVRRRLGQGATPLQSAYRRAVVSATAPLTDCIAYWSMEDGVGATSFASGLSGGLPMRFTGAPDLASDSTSFPCSTPLPVFASGYAYGQVVKRAATGELQLFVPIAIPAAGIAATRIFELSTNGSAPRWMITVDASGDLTLNAYAADGSSLVSSGPAATGINGKSVRVGLHLDQDGADIDWTWSVLEVGESTGSYISGTLSSRTVGSAVGVLLAPDSALTGCTLGHVTVQEAVTSVFELAAQLAAHTGESASARIARLAAESSLESATLGGSGAALGYQRAKTLLDLVDGAAAADLGMVYEPRTAAGLAYRPLTSLQTQRPAVEIAYTDNLLIPFEPDEGDTLTRNKVTVTRDGGTSATSEVTTGALSTQAPPNGVGTYDDAPTLSLAADSQVADQATWRTHVGTVDTDRWTIGVELAHPTIKANLDLVRDILTMDLGDRIVVSAPPTWLPPDDVDQLVTQYTETITPKRFKLTAQCVPAEAYRVGVCDYPDSRYCGDGTVLAEDLDTTETGIDITAPDGMTWTHDDGDFAVAVGGETMTVTGIAGTAPTYTLTVTRSVNGVVKTHTTGDQIDIAEPSYYGI